MITYFEHFLNEAVTIPNLIVNISQEPFTIILDGRKQPTAIVLSTDFKTPVQKFDDFYIVKLSQSFKEVLKKCRPEGGQASLCIRYPYSSTFASQEEWMRVINDFNMQSERLDKKKLAKRLLIDYKVHWGYIERFLGINPEESLTFYPVDKISYACHPDDVEDFADILKSVIVKMKKYDLYNKLGNVKILFKPDTKKTGGAYLTGIKDKSIVTINTKSNFAKDRTDTEMVIIHEFTHEIHQKYMSLDIKKEIANQYNFFMKNNAQTCETKDLKVDNELYIKDILGQRKIKIAELNAKNVAYQIIDPPRPGDPIYVMTRQQCLHSGLVFSSLDGLHNTAVLFPSAYSKTDYNEWFSELVGYELVGKLKDGPARDFLHNILNKL